MLGERERGRQKRKAGATFGLVLILVGLLGQGVGWGAIGEEFLIIPSGAEDPAIAYDLANQRFLMVYRGTNWGLQGQLLDSEGNRVGSGFPISPIAGYRPTVTYDSVNRRFLVVWGGRGQLINADGTLFGTGFFIDRAGGGPSAASYDPVSQSFLVVWIADHVLYFGRIYGQRVGADGQLLGDKIAIDMDLGMQGAPSVAYDPAHQRFLVVYYDGGQISGRWVGADGSLIGNNFQILPDVSRRPGAVVHDASHGRFLVVGGGRRDNKSLVLGQLVNADGSLFGGEIHLGTTTDSEDPVSAAYDPARQRFLVVWNGIYPFAMGNYSGRQVNTDGTLFLDQELPLLPRDYRLISNSAAVAYDSANQRFLMAWERYRDKTAFTNIYGLLFAGLPMKPLASLALNAESFRPGDPLDLDVRVLTPPHASPAGPWSFEAAVWLKTPMSFPADFISMARVGGPGHPVTLPPGSDLTYPLLHLPAIPPVPAGSYRFGVRLNHPITLGEMSLDEAPFEVTSP